MTQSITQIEWTLKASKQLLKLPKEAQIKVKQGVDTLGEWPKMGNIKPLVDRDDYRLRVGRYRVLFSVLAGGEITIIRIDEVKKRDEHTY